MKWYCLALGTAVSLTAGLGAQSGTTAIKTKTEVKNGRDLTVLGCLSRSEEGYTLTESADDPRVVVQYTLSPRTISPTMSAIIASR